MTLLILLAPFIAVGMINTDKASVIGNISSLSLYLTILVTLCICLHLDQNKFPYLNCSFKSILRPCKNKQAKGIIRIISKHYCLIVLVCLFTLGLVMAGCKCKNKCPSFWEHSTGCSNIGLYRKLCLPRLLQSVPRHAQHHQSHSQFNHTGLRIYPTTDSFYYL